MKKGFTLIELLAVIVILAIIALIATPIVLNIINDTKKESLVRSADNYISGVKQAIAAKNIEKQFGPKYCSGSGKDLVCLMNDDSEQELKVNVEGNLPDFVEIYFTNGVINYDSTTKIGYGDKVVTYKDGKLEIDEESNPTGAYICTKKDTATLGNVPEGNYEAGDEYTCTVKAGTSYTFYVVSTTGDVVNLIMDSNICSDGSIPTSSNTCMLNWINETDFNAYGGIGYTYDDFGNTQLGPITAMKYLNMATSSWTIPNVIINYEDPNYFKITTADNSVVIYNSSNQEIVKFDNMKARLPYYEEVGAHFTLNNLRASYYKSGTVDIAGINGYWTTKSESQYGYAYYLYPGRGSQGNNHGPDVREAATWEEFGVRPVISIPKTSIKN